MLVPRTICITIFYGPIELVCLCRMYTTTVLSVYRLLTHPGRRPCTLDTMSICPLLSSLSQPRSEGCRLVGLYTYLYTRLHKPNALPSMSPLPPTVNYRERVTLRLLCYVGVVATPSDSELPRAGNTSPFVLRRTGRHSLRQ